MLFNSLEFLIFFPLVGLLYYWLPQRARWGLILIASCVFYMTFIPAYILILGFTILIDYCAGLYIEEAKGPVRKRVLVLSLVANVGILFVFKYFNFFNANLGDLARFLGWNYSLDTLKLLLPIGLSFHTFQSMSYTIEVYRGHQKAERNPGIFAAFVMFYPQLVAGPIERPQNLLHQFHKPFRFDYGEVTGGLRKMLGGFFKKCVVADSIAPLVDAVYGNPEAYPGFPLALATVLFAIQIYCDFSGYSDIARGSAETLGFRLMKNFEQPYFSASIKEFWSRWHISLSTWFRDYLYIPLGGNRVPAARRNLNLLVTFMVSGFWHGANWTFIAWGMLHGLYLVAGSVLSRPRAALAAALGLDRLPRLGAALGALSTFLLVCYAWIYFRADSLPDALYISTHIFAGWGELAAAAAEPGRLAGILRGYGLDLSSIAVPIASFAVFEAAILMHRRGFRLPPALAGNRWARWSGYYVLVLWILIFGSFTEQQFIYFQF